MTDAAPEPVATLLLPFVTSGADAEAALRRWLQRAGVPRSAVQQALRPVYVPYFVFEMQASASYSGKAGAHRRVYRQQRGLRDAAGYNLEQAGTETDWTWKQGTVSLPREGMPVLARSTAPGPVSGITWALRQLQAFATDGVRGVPVLAADLGREQAAAVATAAATARLRAAALAAIGGDVQQLAAFVPQLLQVRCQLALLPLYTGSFTFAGNDRPVAVDGCSGQVSGQAPVTGKQRLQRWLAGVAVALGVGAAYVGWMLLDGYDVEDIVALPLLLGLMVSVFLLFLWLQDKLPAVLLLLAYVLTLVLVGVLLAFTFDNPGVVTAAEAILVVMGLLLLPGAFGGKPKAGAGKAI